jgi:flagellar protein FliS
MNPLGNNPYLQASVETASPAQRLVMLLERLVLDCRRALQAQEASDHSQAHGHLLHAQDIVSELRSTLRIEAWDAATALDSLYGHLLVQLVEANVRRDSATTTHCLDLSEQLAAVWREAAAATTLAGAGA